MRLKKFLPTREQLREIRFLNFVGHLIFEPNLWHMNRSSLSAAFLVGSICCFLPIPFQTIPCVLICIWIRCNVPLAVAIVWISNPITMGPMLYFAYRVGLMILSSESALTPIDPSFNWFKDQLAVIWQPLLLGSLICGISMGSTGFVAIRIYYRWRISRYKRRKREARRRGKVIEP